jgi:hypothetical protein
MLVTTSPLVQGRRMLKESAGIPKKANKRKTNDLGHEVLDPVFSSL